MIIFILESTPILKKKNPPKGNLNTRCTRLKDRKIKQGNQPQWTPTRKAAPKFTTRYTNRQVLGNKIYVSANSFINSINGKVNLEKDTSHQTGRTLNIYFRDFLRNDTDSKNRKYKITVIVIILKKKLTSTLKRSEYLYII